MNDVSLTSLLTAYLRGYHSKHDNPKIFDDFLAFDILTEERRNLIEQGLAYSLKLQNPALYETCPDQAQALAYVLQAMTGPPNVLSRSRYTEDHLGKAIRQGIDQYVILGAGMDTFAFRDPNLTKGLKVFELDLPVTQSFKRNRLNELGWKIPTNLHFIPVDFTKDNLTAALASSPYKPQAKSFFSWLGVVMYLTLDEISTTLRTLANCASAGSILIFDYLDTNAFKPGKCAPRVQSMLHMAQHAGEPMKTGFDPDSLADYLAPLGLQLRENLSPADIQKRFFQGRSDGYYACEHVHFALAEFINY